MKINFQILIGMCAKAHKGYMLETYVSNTDSRGIAG